MPQNLLANAATTMHAANTELETLAVSDLTTYIEEARSDFNVAERFVQYYEFAKSLHPNMDGLLTAPALA